MCVCVCVCVCNLGIEPRSPTLQVNSLPAEPPGKPFIAASLFHGIMISYMNYCSSLLTGHLVSFPVPHKFFIHTATLGTILRASILSFFLKLPILIFLILIVTTLEMINSNHLTAQLRKRRPALTTRGEKALPIWPSFLYSQRLPLLREDYFV